MKSTFKKVIASTMAAVSLTTGMVGMNAGAYYMYSWEQGWHVFTNAYPSAPDVTSDSECVTIPTGSNAVDFYCHTFSGNSYVQFSLTNPNIVSGVNSATIGAQYETASIYLKSNWLNYNGGSPTVCFKAQMMNIDVQSNANIAGVAY